MREGEIAKSPDRPFRDGEPEERDSIGSGPKVRPASGAGAQAAAPGWVKEDFAESKNREVRGTGVPAPVSHLSLV